MQCKRARSYLSTYAQDENDAGSSFIGVFADADPV